MALLQQFVFHSIPLNLPKLITVVYSTLTFPFLKGMLQFLKIAICLSLFLFKFNIYVKFEPLLYYIFLDEILKTKFPFKKGKTGLVIE